LSPISGRRLTSTQVLLPEGTSRTHQAGRPPHAAANPRAKSDFHTCAHPPGPRIPTSQAEAFVSAYPLVADALVLEEVPRWFCFKSTEIRSIHILCIAVQTTDETLLSYLVIEVGMIVRWACTDAFKLGDANPDLRET
jgi:hypothetical protein